MDITPHLEKLERTVDVMHVAQSEELQKQAWDYEPVERLPLIVSFFDKVSKIRTAVPDWPLFPYAEVFHDPAKMLLDELSELYVGALVGDNKMYTIRANYGVGILPSLFGCRIELHGERDMPWIESLSWEEVKQAISRGVPDISGGLMERVVETEAYFREVLGPYPKLSQVVRMTVCDTQGPFNLAAEILGNRIYTDLYDHPDVVHELLDLVTETYIQAGRAQKEFLNEPLDSGYNWHFRMRGGTRIAEDYALSISPKQYEEFVVPYNERAYQAFGGGYILYCGEGRQILDGLLSTPGTTGIYLWSENAEDLLMVYPKAASRGICVLCCGPPWQFLSDEICTGLIWERVASSLEEARRWTAS